MDLACILAISLVAMCVKWRSIGSTSAAAPLPLFQMCLVIPDRDNITGLSPPVF